MSNKLYDLIQFTNYQISSYTIAVFFSKATLC